MHMRAQGLADTEDRQVFTEIPRGRFEGADVVHSACGHLHASAVTRCALFAAQAALPRANSCFPAHLGDKTAQCARCCAGSVANQHCSLTAGSQGRLFMWGHVDDARACSFPQMQKELFANTSLAYAQVKESMPWTACFRQVHFTNSEM